MRAFAAVDLEPPVRDGSHLRERFKGIALCLSDRVASGLVAINALGSWKAPE
jgi:hypothetical protein